MEEKNEIIIGNVTTLINTLSLMIAGVIFGIIGAVGLNLPVDQTSLAGAIGFIIATIFSYINAKYHNTYFDKDNDTLTIDVSNLNENQVDAINNFVENADKVNNNNIEDIDPASDYDGC